MISPSKFISYNESALSKVDKVYEAIDEGITVSELYARTVKYFESVDVFMAALEILFLSDKLVVNFKDGVVKKC